MATNFTTSGVHDGAERLTLAVWCHFAGGNSIHANHGVSSVGDSGVGDYRVNMSPGLGTDAYAAVSDCEANSKSAMNTWNDTMCQILIRSEATAYADNNHAAVCIGGGGVS